MQKVYDIYIEKGLTDFDSLEISKNILNNFFLTCS